MRLPFDRLRVDGSLLYSSNANDNHTALASRRAAPDVDFMAAKTVDWPHHASHVHSTPKTRAPTTFAGLATTYNSL